MRKSKKKYLDPKRFRTEKARKRTEKRRNPFVRNLNNLYKAASSSGYIREKDFIRIVQIPEIFSIWKKPEPLLKKFKIIEDFLRKGKNIELNMTNINYISEDAILYLISRIEFYRIKYPGQSVSGTFPTNPNCRDFLVKSRFPEYVVTQVKCPKDSTIYPIKDGRSADPLIVAEVMDYISTIIKFSEDESAKIYGAIIELLQNTKQHAYDETDLQGKWWLIAIPSTDRKKVHFTILDNGYGIPSTVKRKSLEILQSGIPIKKFGVDATLIESALDGKFQRTRTGKSFRGQGLPTVFELTTMGQIDNLRIISNYGHVLTGPNKSILEKYTFSNKFDGTLISWDFIESNHNDTN